MKAVVFAGGVGSRLWPISRKNSPKQFEPILSGKSTLRLTIDRLLPLVSPQDIFIATLEKYLPTIKRQIPEIPGENYSLEPEMRDLAPAVGLITARLEKSAPDEPFAILWSDHIIKDEEAFRKILSLAEKTLKGKAAKMVFIGEKPTWANQNCGWIALGKTLGKEGRSAVLEYLGWHYRPPLQKATEYFKGRKHFWNTGYFVTTPSFLMAQYQKHKPEIFKGLKKITDDKSLKEIYPTFEKISFDDAIVKKIKLEDAVVVTGCMGWKDIGTPFALKEALQKEENDIVSQGKTLDLNSKDCLIYNYTDALVATIGLKKMLVINTKDALLVCPKDKVPEIKNLVEKLKEDERYRPLT